MAHMSGCFSHSLYYRGLCVLLYISLFKGIPHLYTLFLLLFSFLFNLLTINEVWRYTTSCLGRGSRGMFKGLDRVPADYRYRAIQIAIIALYQRYNYLLPFRQTFAITLVVFIRIIVGPCRILLFFLL